MRRGAWAAAGLLLASACGQASSEDQARPAAQESEGMAELRAGFLDQFDETVSKLEQLAEAMPPERYAWAPMEGVASVARAHMHIARYNYMIPDQSLGVAPPQGIDYEALEESVTDKAEVARVMRASAAHARAVIAGLSDEELASSKVLFGQEKPAWAVVLQMLSHMNEHLGQQIAYARMNQVVPPWSR